MRASLLIAPFCPRFNRFLRKRTRPLAERARTRTRRSAPRRRLRPNARGARTDPAPFAGPHRAGPDAKKVAKGRGHRHRAAIPRGGSKPFARTSLHTEAGRANADVNPKEEPAAPLSHRLRKATRRRSFERTSPMRAGSRPCRAMLRKKAPRKEETRLSHPRRPVIGASRARVDPASARRGHG